jgi:hypothetical protein
MDTRRVWNFLCSTSCILSPLSPKESAVFSQMTFSLKSFIRRERLQEKVAPISPLCTPACKRGSNEVIFSHSQSYRREKFLLLYVADMLLEQLLPFFAPRTSQHVNDNNFCAAQQIHTQPLAHTNGTLAYKSCAGALGVILLGQILVQFTREPLFGEVTSFT